MLRPLRAPPAPLEDDATIGVVHHMILYKSFVPASKCFRECLNMPSDSQLVWAWAVGMAAFPMPADVGFPVGKFTDTSYTSLIRSGATTAYLVYGAGTNSFAMQLRLSS